MPVTDVDVMVENIGTGYQWVRQTVPTYTYPNDLPYLVTGNSGTANNAKSSVAVWQGNWWTTRWSRRWAAHDHVVECGGRAVGDGSGYGWTAARADRARSGRGHGQEHI